MAVTIIDRVIVGTMTDSFSTSTLVGVLYLGYYGPPVMAQTNLI
jgi:hypothetical protein